MISEPHSTTLDKFVAHRKAVSSLKKAFYMIDHMANASASPSFTSDLTHKLVLDAQLLADLSPDAGDLHAEEVGVIDGLLKNYEQLDAPLRQELADLASLLAGEQGHALRAAICRPGAAQIAISEDSAEATLTLLPPAGGGKPLATSDIISMLKNRGIIFGVDLPGIAIAVNEVARGLHKSLELRIASARNPVDGQPGNIEFIIPHPLAPNAKSKRQQWMVKTGDLLARLMPPIAGTPGSNIFGHEIPANPGKPAELLIGDGVSFDPAHSVYIADFDGLAAFDGIKLDMRRHFVWNGDLTIHDPPIAFDGSVVIHGTVRDGVTLSATGDIEISEGVEAATVISSAGSVLIRQGITGKRCGYVSAKTFVDVKYVENGTVYCEENILVRHAVLHSRLTAGDRVAVELGKGAVFGGEIRAGNSILAKSFGNAAGVPTRLSAGHTWSSLRQLQECEAALAALRQTSALCETLIAKFRHAKPQLSSLSMPERQALASLIKRHMVLKSRIQNQQTRYDKLDSDWILESAGEIKCQESLYPGVTVKLGSSIALVSANHSACTLRLQPEGKRIVVTSPSGRKSLL